MEKSNDKKLYMIHDDTIRDSYERLTEEEKQLFEKLDKEIKITKQKENEINRACGLTK